MDEAGKMLRGEIPKTDKIPISPADTMTTTLIPREKGTARISTITARILGDAIFIQSPKSEKMELFDTQGRAHGECLLTSQQPNGLFQYRAGRPAKPGIYILKITQRPFHKERRILVYNHSSI